MSEYATAQNFKDWKVQAEKMSPSELTHAIKDCKEATEAMKDWNPVKELYYRDQMMTYADERRRRLQKAIAKLKSHSKKG